MRGEEGGHAQNYKITVGSEDRMAHPTRALSLRNLVLGYKCGRVFPAGVGPGSPSRGAVNWLTLRLSRSVETRWWYGWLRMAFPRCAPFPSSNLVPFGRWWHARGRWHCRGEPGSTLSIGHVPDSAKGGGKLDC